MASVALATLGCKVNQSESERLVQELSGLGFDIAGFDDAADAYVINSCTVTAEADHKSRKLARRAFRSNANALVVLAGCYATRATSESAGLPGQILLVPSSQKFTVPHLLAERLLDGTGARRGNDEGATLLPRSRTRHLVNVQDGCDNYCTYCIVPFARGAPRSRPAADVIEEVRSLVERGVAEVVMTGINIGRYQSNGLGLTGLIGRVLELPLPRLRLSSIEPPDVDDGLRELLAREPRICSHLHVPLQSGSDAVLERMGRRYRSRDYARIAESIREARPDLALTTDVIAGFPGETEDEAAESADFLRRLAPAKLHVFKYSGRPGTPAARFPSQVDTGAKTERASHLARLDLSLGEEFARAQVGREMEVVVENVEGFTATGVSGNYVRCYFKGEQAEKGTIVKVRGARTRGRALEGHRV